jgi:hypothetical protein
MDSIWNCHLRIVEGPAGPVVDGPPALPWAQPITFLVHGYNNTEVEAANHFDRLLGIMSSLRILPAELTSRRCWLVVWQGYASIGGGRKMPAGGAEVSYPAQIWTARRVAVALKSFIDGYGGPNPEINIIAHSLGCRAVLELLHFYSLFPVRPRFRRVVLLAAAVPIKFLETDLSLIGVKLRGRLRGGAAIPDETLVLFSGADRVLRREFHAGEWAAGEGFFSPAVGLVGKPSDLWHQIVPTSNDHSDYFHDQRSAEIIAKTFGIAVPLRLPKSPLACPMPSPAPRRLATSGLPEMWLTKRRL